LRIRELAIQRASSPFGTGADAYTTGLGIWGSSLVMARWLTDAPMQKILKSATVVELGAGCGVAGLTAAVYTRAASVLMTDLNEATLDNLRHNVELNRTAAHTPPTPPALQCEVQVAALDWSDPSTYPPAGKAHVLLGCDLVYHKESVAPLIRVARKLVRPGGSLLLVSPASNRDGMKQLLEGVLGPKGGFKLVGAQVAPQEYLSNPLTEAVGSDVQFLLHFSDLVDGRYRLLHFRRQPSAHAAASSEPAAP
ncbi:putative methyltransferase-domain-containing protein, partial [Tribonema minus]